MGDSICHMYGCHWETVPGSNAGDELVLIVSASDQFLEGLVLISLRYPENVPK